MKISNFKIISTKKGLDIFSPKTIIAEVDITTGIWPFKKTKVKQVVNDGIGYWFFLDTGKFTPSYDVEELYRAYTALHSI